MSGQDIGNGGPTLKKLETERLRDRREERQAEAWDNLMNDLNPEEVPARGQHRIKDLVRQAFSLKSDTADYDVIADRLDNGGRVSGMNLSILFFAILIASIGLNTNSTAVIIGAMLISPLMGTIQLMGLGIATVNAQKFKKAIVGFLFQVTTAILTSTLYFLISPVKEATSEILGRTSPSVFDILIATFGGLAGIIALTRKDSTSNVIPGVAIATALMPPLCTCGFSIAGGRHPDGPSHAGVRDLDSGAAASSAGRTHPKRDHRTGRHDPPDSPGRHAERWLHHFKYPGNEYSDL